MRRGDFQGLAVACVKNAQVLFKAHRYAAAFYLAGLSVECAIKSCIATKTKRYEFHNLRLAKDSHIHDLEDLVRVADLSNALATKARDGQFAARWGVVKNWGIESRYASNVSRRDARDMIAAVAGQPHGVLAW